MFDNITSQAPIHCASTHRPLSIISEDPSDEIEGSEFRFENDEDEIEDDGNKEDDKMEGYSDEEGNEMEEGEGEYDGGCRFEKVDSGLNMPTREVRIMDVDGNEPVSQELPRVKDGTTHHLNVSTCVLPSSPSTISNPSSIQHDIETLSSLPPLLLKIPCPLCQLPTRLPNCQVVTMSHFLI